MNKKQLIMLLPLFALTLSSCGEQIKWKEHLEDYAFEMNFHPGFNILQLTDIHWSVNSSTMNSKRYLDKVFEEAHQHVSGKIDLVELTGDQFMLANKYHVETFLNYFEEKAEQYGFKYAIIWGNHDRHGLYSPNWLANQYKEAKHCLYAEPDDDLYGRSNFVINLKAGNDVKWQIANLDSGASFSESPLSIGRDYDYIRQDQVDWWVNENNMVNNAPTIAYYHIPQQDNLEAWNMIHNDNAHLKHNFFKLEGFADAGKPEYASSFFSTGSELGSLKAAFMGHAHNVDWTVTYKDVVLGLGVKTGIELYFAHIDPNDPTPELQEGLANVNASLPEGSKITEKFDLIGASLVTIKDASKFELQHLYLNEREGTDFVRWVKY